MNRKQKGILIAATVMFLGCVISTFSESGSFSEKVKWTLIYWGIMAVIFGFFLVLTRGSGKGS